MIPEINLIGIGIAALIVACVFGAYCASVVWKIKQKNNEKSSK